MLEDTYQVIVRRPYFANVGKRLVKTPKVYFTDVGTLCYLAGLKDPEHTASGPMGGAIMETAVLSEIVKTLTHRGNEPRVYFWRTQAGTEVDFVVDAGAGLVPVGQAVGHPRPAMAAAIKTFQQRHGKRRDARIRGSSRRYTPALGPWRQRPAFFRALGSRFSMG